MILGIYKSFDDGVDHPQLAVGFEFDFCSTDPYVYSINVESRPNHFGYWAVATFRTNPQGLMKTEVHSPHSPENALERLITHLRNKFIGA